MSAVAVSGGSVVDGVSLPPLGRNYRGCEMPRALFLLLSVPASFSLPSSLSLSQSFSRTAAFCYSSVKYAQMAWRASLPLIRKKKAFNFIVLASCFPHRWYRQGSRNQLVLCLPVPSLPILWAFCHRQTLSCHLYSADTCTEEKGMPAHNNNNMMRRHKYITRPDKCASDVNHSERSSGLYSLLAISGA